MENRLKIITDTLELWDGNEKTGQQRQDARLAAIGLAKDLERYKRVLKVELNRIKILSRDVSRITKEKDNYKQDLATCLETIGKQCIELEALRKKKGVK